MPSPRDRWLRAKLTDPRAKQVLEKMTTDLKPDDPRVEKLMGAMLLKEFLAQRVAPLQACSRPLWKLGDEGDDLRLRPDSLSEEDLGVAIHLLVGDDLGYPPDSHLPLYRRPDGAKVAAAMPVFDGRGLMPPAPSEATGPTLAAKKKTEGAAAPSGTQQPGTAAPPLAQKGGTSPRTSLARSSSRGLEDRPQEKLTSAAKLAPKAPVLSSPAEVPQAPEPPASSSAAISLQILETTLPPPSATPPARDPSASPDSLEKALSALTWLRDDLQGTDCRLVAGRLELISGWLHSDASVRAALGQAVAASEEDKRTADQAAAAREVALKDAEAAKERCRAAEVELENLRKEWAAVARQFEVREEKKLEKEVEAERIQLEIKAKVLAEDREAFKSLEERSREALGGLYEKVLQKPLVTDNDGPAQLLPQLIKALEDVVDGIGPMVEGEAHALSSSALTRVLSHLHLRDPNADLGVLLEPVDEERCTAAAKAVKGQVEALLKKLLTIDPAPPADGAADRATKSNDGDTADERKLPDDGARG
nr:chromosome partition protein Smc-like [Aegilops tauschii subsp. strangulata]